MHYKASRHARRILSPPCRWRLRSFCLAALLVASVRPRQAYTYCFSIICPAASPTSLTSRKRSKRDLRLRSIQRNSLKTSLFKIMPVTFEPKCNRQNYACYI
uniref:Putative secreted protein n=1 Tax=Ixodes scapularis TaxID=6945 RepID=A0A4D5RYS3_IXOSC